MWPTAPTIIFLTTRRTSQSGIHFGRHALVRRCAVDVFGEDPHPAPRRDEQLLRDRLLRQLGGDIHRRIAHADHEHASPTHVMRLERRQIGMGMHLDAVERAREIRGCTDPSDGRCRRTARHRSRVSPFDSATCHSASLPRTARFTLVFSVMSFAQAEAVDIGVEIVGDLRMVRIVGIIRRNRKILELHAMLRGVDVQRLVAGAAAVGILVDPIAADHARHLEAVERQVRDPSALWRWRSPSSRRRRYKTLVSPLCAPVGLQGAGIIGRMALGTSAMRGRLHPQIDRR